MRSAVRTRRAGSTVSEGGVVCRRTYEPTRDLLTGVRNHRGGMVYPEHLYANDALGRRTARNGERYGYNARSELVSAATDGADGYAYAYDDIGNRLSSTEPNGTLEYIANNLNQYTAVSNSVPSVTPCEAFNPIFDADGNQTLVKTKTGIWSITYNGENRPVSWACGATNLTMRFDRMGRRVEYLETVADAADDTIATNKHQRFVYDGYLCLQIVNAQTGVAEYAFEWDPTEPVATRPMVMQRTGNWNLFYTHDGNKNVSELVYYQRARGVAAHYEYAPFGAVTARTRGDGWGALDFSTLNPFRFSGEFSDDTLGLVYYNYLHYEPVTGRWLTRDGVQTKEVYGIVHNSLVNGIDVLGALEDGRKSCKIDKTQINCLGYAIGADYCVDPHYMSIDGLMVALGYRGSSVPDTECKCDPCDAKVVYVYVYINPGLFARLNAKGNVDFEALSGDERNRLYDLYRRIFLEGNPNPFAMEDFWCNGGDGVVDYHAMTKECCRDSSKWYYVAARFDREDPRGRARQLERESYFPNKHQIVAGKCYKKER